MDVVHVGGFPRIRRRLPMWEIHGARVVHWERTREDASFGAVRDRHFRCDGGATWMRCVHREYTGHALLFAPPGAAANIRSLLEWQGWTVTDEVVRT